MRKVTIMIPTYNQAQHIEKCVKSAMDQDYHNLEIIISDDSTNTETEIILRGKTFQDPRVIYFHNKKRLGRVDNYRDTLYNKATGDYVLNLDGDDWLINPTYISKAVEILTQNPNVVCVIAKIKYYMDETDTFTNGSGYEKVDSIIKGTEYLTLNANKQLPFNHLTSLYRKSHATDLNFYSVNTVWTDSQSLFRLIHTGDIAFVNEYVGVWRIHNINESKQFYATVVINELFLSEQSAAVFFKTRGQTKDFDADKWLETWKYEHTKEGLIFFLKTKNVQKIFKLFLFLTVRHAIFFIKIIPKLTIDVSRRSLSRMQRKVYNG